MSDCKSEERDPTGRKSKTPGAKLDAGKPQVVRGFLRYFPRAIIAVARVSEFGARKYTWNGWESVPDGECRYAEAEARHMLAEFIDGPVTPDSGLLHAAHKAWNAMATLELMLRKRRPKA